MSYFGPYGACAIQLICKLILKNKSHMVNKQARELHAVIHERIEDSSLWHDAVVKESSKKCVDIVF